MKSDQNHPERLSVAVKQIKGSIYRVRSQSNPGRFYLVDVEKDYCSCSLELDPDDRHIRRAKEFLRIKSKGGPGVV